MKIALAQLRCEKGAWRENLAAHRRVVEEANRHRTDIVVFPEMSLTGYVDPTRHPDMQLDLNGPEVAEAVELTRGNSMTVLAGIVERNPGSKPFITQLVLRDGRLLGVYRKVTIAEDEQAWFVPGGPVHVFTHGSVKFGVAICADVGNEEVFARAARQGAALVLVAAAPGLYGEQASRDWQSGFEWWQGECQKNLGEWARRYGIMIAVATQAGRTFDEDFPGGGYAFNAGGELVAATPDWSEGVLYATMDIAGRKAHFA